MTNKPTDAELWDDGCKTDDVRNNWLIPSLVSILNREAPGTILDVGSATGFVPRSIDPLLSYRPLWTLADRDNQRLALAKRSLPADMKAEFLEGDFLSSRFEATFECAIASFSLLEMDVPRTFAHLAAVISANGAVHIAQPDAWIDVLAAAEAGDIDPREFLKRSVSISKIDRFTQEAYPFRAMRTEHLILHAIEAGFYLSGFMEGEIRGKRNYLLSFKKRELPCG